MKRLGALSVLVCIFFIGASVYGANEEAGSIGNKALELVKNGKVDEGMELLKKASQAEPLNPVWHMNYGTILMMKGNMAFNAEDRKDALITLEKAESELLTAIRLFKESEWDKEQKSNCHSMLGDIALYAFNDKEKARSYYQESLKEWARNPAALKAMGRLNNPSSK